MEQKDQAVVRTRQIDPSMVPFEVGVKDTGETRTVTPVGDIDLMTADVVQRTVGSALQAAQTVVLDFSRVTFIDSTGIAMLLTSVKAARKRNVRLVLRPAAPEVQRLIDLCGLGHVLSFEPSHQSARQSAA